MLKSLLNIHFDEINPSRDVRKLLEDNIFETIQKAKVCEDIMTLKTGKIPVNGAMIKVLQTVHRKWN